MKNKFLVLFSLILIVVTLSGCQSTTNPINSNEFDMKFDTLDKENNVANFIVFGYPNEEESKQVLDVVVNSLKKQDLKENIKVNLYSNFQKIEDNEEPFYGTLEYKDGAIVKKNIVTPTQEEYLKYASY